MVVVLAATVVTLAVWGFLQARHSFQPPLLLTDPAEEIDGVQFYADLSRDHVDTPVDYAQSPPVGGDHLPPPQWQDCGFYDQTVQDEAAVHSLEHGAVWITYSRDLPGSDVARLQELTGDHPYLLVSPYDDLPSPLVLSAWGVQLQLDTVDDERLPVFLTTYLQGEQTPEPGAACSGGNVLPR